MDRESSSKSSNKPVDTPADRVPPPPRGSGGHGVNEMKAQQRAVFRPQERPIGHAASANSDRTDDAAGGGHVTALAALRIEAAPC